jgi:hypothetical protein
MALASSMTGRPSGWHVSLDGGLSVAGGIFYFFQLSSRGGQFSIASANPDFQLPFSVDFS